MSQKVVFIAGLVGLVFGFLFSATLGVSFFEEDTNNNNVNSEMMDDDNNLDNNMDDETDDEVDPAIEQFRLDYNLSESIYIPVSGQEVYDLIAGNEDFIVFAGRKGCPYCQQYVPVLQSAAKSLGVDKIYYIDITISDNDAYLDDAGFEYPNSTFVYINGMLEDNIIGFVNETSTLDVLTPHFGS